MSIPYKLIIPLLDDSITKEDVKEENGFIGIYNTDMNRPQLTNHIFLLYDYNTDSEGVKRYHKLKKSPYLYDWDVVMIKHKPYLLYSFAILNKSVKNIMKNNFFITRNDKFRIYKFWDYKDEDINDYIITQRIKETFKDSVVPETDWKPDITDIFKHKKTGISVQRYSSFFCFNIT